MSSDEKPSGDSSASVTIKKKKTPAQLRQRSTAASAAGDTAGSAAATAAEVLPPEPDDVESRLEMAKEEQKLRERAAGVSAIGLYAGKDVPLKILADTETWSLERGGVMPKAAAAARDRDRDRDNEDNRVFKGISNTFAAETGERNQDAEMLQYIEKRMLEEQGLDDASRRKETEYERRRRELYQVPDALKNIKGRLEEDRVNRGMLSNAVLSGIPEVDLGVESKIKTIEDTEAAKDGVIRKRMEGGRGAHEDHDINYASSIFGFAAARRATREGADKAEEADKRRRLAPGEAFALAKQRALDEGKLDSVVFEKLPPDVADAKRRTSAAQIATDDIELAKYKKRMRRF